jgi:hypothetical protein
MHIDSYYSASQSFYAVYIEILLLSSIPAEVFALGKVALNYCSVPPGRQVRLQDTLSLGLETRLRMATLW